MKELYRMWDLKNFICYARNEGQPIDYFFKHVATSGRHFVTEMRSSQQDNVGNWVFAGDLIYLEDNDKSFEVKYDLIFYVVVENKTIDISDLEPYEVVGNIHEDNQSE